MFQCVTSFIGKRYRCHAAHYLHEFFYLAIVISLSGQKILGFRKQKLHFSDTTCVIVYYKLPKIDIV